MCWTTNKFIHRESKIAEHDIKMFKVCSPSILGINTVVSYYWELPYALNQVYDSLKNGLRLEVYGPDYAEINEGFHSYSLDCNIVKQTVISIWNNRTFLDSYNVDSIIVYGYIPKGSVYYINERGEYVSDKICLTKIKEL